MRTYIPKFPGKATPKKLDGMRRAWLLTFYQDMKLFGYRTECVNHLRQQIVKAKQGAK